MNVCVCDRVFRREIWTWDPTNNWAIEAEIQVSRMDDIYFRKSSNKAFFTSEHGISYICTKAFYVSCVVKIHTLNRNEATICVASVNFDKARLSISKIEMWMFYDSWLTCCV